MSRVVLAIGRRRFRDRTRRPAFGCVWRTHCYINEETMKVVRRKGSHRQRRRRPQESKGVGQLVRHPLQNGCVAMQSVVKVRSRAVCTLSGRSTIAKLWVKCQSSHRGIVSVTCFCASPRRTVCQHRMSCILPASLCHQAVHFTSWALHQTHILHQVLHDPSLLV